MGAIIIQFTNNACLDDGIRNGVLHWIVPGTRVGENVGVHGVIKTIRKAMHLERPVGVLSKSFLSELAWGDDHLEVACRMIMSQSDKNE